MLSPLIPIFPPVRTYELATRTRFYHPAGDRRRSQPHAWLMSLDGKRRLKLSRQAVQDGPIWTGPRQVAWIERGQGRDELWVATLPSLRRRRLAIGSYLALIEGRAVVDGTTATGLLPKRAAIRGTTATLASEAAGLSVRWRGRRYPISNPDVRFKVSTASDGYQAIRPKDSIVGAYEGQGVVVGRPVAKFALPLSAHDGLTTLVELDSLRNVARIVPVDASQIEFDVQGRRFIALSNRRLGSLGDLGVWTSTLFVGALSDLRPREVRLPFGYTTLATLRP